MTAKKTYTRPDTILAVAGRDPDNNFGIVNPPVYHASTILSPTMAKFENRIPFEGFGYGRNGTPTQKALEDAVAAIEGAHRSIAVQSGLAAVTGAIVGFFKTGDHLLLTDNAYGPARRFANATLKNFGVETTFFDPMIGTGIEKLIRPNTKVVYLEAPGSQTFEVQDVDAIAKVAKKHGCAVLIDNTWATPLYFKPFEHGCDVSIHAGTKYIVGHSDAMLGIISCANRPMFELVKTACMNFGTHAAPDDSYLALRGLRTMAVRLDRAQASALVLAERLAAHPAVTTVRYPGLPSDPFHERAARLMDGFGSMLAFEVDGGAEAAQAVAERVRVLVHATSLGGVESLIERRSRYAGEGAPESLLRLSVGIEDVEDLWADLSAALGPE